MPAGGGFRTEFQAIGGGSAAPRGRRVSELAAQRDAFAQELETRLAGERRASHDLDARWRELDRLIADEKQTATGVEQRLRRRGTALAETDARLRYRRLELNADLQWRTTESADWEPRLAELDEQIARWRATVSELAGREASVRARLAQIELNERAADGAAADQRAWMAVSRQLAGDLAGEVSRLARATASKQCVCRDAHPRLRPIVEALGRQLDVLDSLVEQQQRSAAAADLQSEVEHLVRSQAELRLQVDHLLDRRQAPCGRQAGRRPVAMDQASDTGSFSAADAEQLERRRLELEQERFELVKPVGGARAKVAPCDPRSGRRWTGSGRRCCRCGRLSTCTRAGDSANQVGAGDPCRR